MLKRLVRRMSPAPLWELLQRLRLRWMLETYPRRIVRHRYGGVELAVQLADPLGEGWYDHDWPVLSEIDLLRRHRLRPGARVFDLGAHQGVVALMLASVVGPTGQVVAVEANGHNAGLCVRNRELNAMPWVEVVPAAVAAEEGTLRFNRGLNGQVAEAGAFGGTVTVPSVTADGLAARYGQPDVVFVDVEGFECQVFRGARGVWSARPDWFVEVHAGCGLEAAGGSVEEVLNWFPPAEYEQWVHTEGDPRPVPRDEALPERLAGRFFLTAVKRGTAPHV
jgi:FkbM family methyltransferase